MFISLVTHETLHESSMLLIEILIFGNLSGIGLSVVAKYLAEESPYVVGVDEVATVEERHGLKDYPHKFPDYSNVQSQQEQEVYKQHRRQFPSRSSGTNNCLKQVLAHMHGIRILNATGMNHVTPRVVDPLCILLQTTTATTNNPGIHRTSTKNTIDFRGVSVAEEDVIVFRLNRSDLEKVIISKAELRVFMIARNESTKLEPKKYKQSNKQHKEKYKQTHKQNNKEKYNISIYGLSNDSFSILASMNVRISNSKWQKFLLSTSYVQNLLHLAVEELVLKINCENCEQHVELYKGPHMNKESRRENRPQKHHHRQKKENIRQSKRAPKLMLEIKEAI